VAEAYGRGSNQRAVLHDASLELEAGELQGPLDRLSWREYFTGEDELVFRSPASSCSSHARLTGA
jgi:hypothetical protein